MYLFKRTRCVIHGMSTCQRFAPPLTGVYLVVRKPKGSRHKEFSWTSLFKQTERRHYAIMDRYVFPERPFEKEKDEAEALKEAEKEIRKRERKVRQTQKLQRKIIKLSLQEPGIEIRTFDDSPPVQPENPKLLYMSVIGPPNAGKSTFINRFCRTRVSAVSRKKHTTRHQVTGVFTEGDTQVVIIDTPGISSPYDIKKLNKWLATESWNSLEEAELVVVVLDAVKSIDASTQSTIDNLKKYIDKRNAENDPLKAVLFVNKSDLYDKGHFRDKKVYPALERFRFNFPHLDDVFDKVYYGSFLTGVGYHDLKNFILDSAVDREWEYNETVKTTMSDLDRTFEIIREKVYRRYNSEVPYNVTFECRGWGTDDRRGVTFINMDLIVPKTSLKKLIYGRGGHSIRGVSFEAQRDIEAALQRKVMLFLNVVVRKTRPDISEGL